MSFKSWWNSLWEGNQNMDEDGLPRPPEIFSAPEVKACKPEKDISEPVLSFIKLYKENPKNFRVRREINPLGYSTGYIYSVFDRVNRKLFSIYKVHHYGTYTGTTKWVTGINTGWATQDEMQEVFDVILEERKFRHKSLKDKRHLMQRERLTKLYKGE